MSKSNKYRAMFMAVAGAAMAGASAYGQDNIAAFTVQPGATAGNNWPTSVYGAAPIIQSGSNGNQGAPDGSGTNETEVAGKVEAQTFTPTVNFNLGAVSFVLNGAADTVGNTLSIQLFQLNNGPALNAAGSGVGYTLGGATPNEVGSELLGGGAGETFTFAGTANNEIFEFDFGPSDQVQLQAGVTYSLEFWANASNPGYFIARNASLTYPAGRLYTQTTEDGGAELDHSTEARSLLNSNTAGRDANFAVYATTSIGIQPTWKSTKGGSWSTAGNWDVGVPNDVTDTATFGPSITAPAVVTLDGSKTVNAVTFNSETSYTVAAGSGGSLLMNAGGGAAVISALAGTHTISAPIVAESSLTLVAGGTDGNLNISGNISGTGGLSLQGGGTTTLSGSNSYSGPTIVDGFLGASGTPGTTIIASPSALPFNTALSVGITNNASQVAAIGSLVLAKGLGTVNVSSFNFTNGGNIDSPLSEVDITNNKLSINYGTVSGATTPLAQIELEIASGTMGLSNGFDGDGVNGQLFSSDVPNNEQTAVYDSGSSVLVGNTIVGDVNVDGTVNITDLLILLNNYGTTGQYWGSGDTNADGSVNITDLLALLNNYGESAALGTSLHSSQVVPEPATLSVLALGGLGLMGRRRNRKA